MDHYREQAGKQFSVYDTTAVQRMAFLQRVYLTFFLSLVMATIGAYVGLSSFATLKVVAQWFWPLVIAEILVLLATYAVRKIPGVNLLALGSFTFLSGLIMSPLLAMYIAAKKAHLIQEALILTSIIFLGLTVYVFVTKKDFSFLGGTLFMGLFAMIGVGILLIFLPASPFIHKIFCAVGAFLFSCFILYDTSRLLSEWEDNDYVAFALELYLDFVNLFLYLLRFLGLSKDE